MHINLYELELLEKINHQEKIHAMKYKRYRKANQAEFKPSFKLVNRKSNVCCA